MTALLRATREVKLCGGPLASQVVTLPRGDNRYHVGPKGSPFWTYIYAGKVGMVTYFALWPRTRLFQNVVLRALKATGKHPGIEAEVRKRTPKVGRTDKRGQGALRRMMRRKEKMSWLQRLISK